MKLSLIINLFCFLESIVALFIYLFIVSCEFNPKECDTTYPKGTPRLDLLLCCENNFCASRLNKGRAFIVTHYCRHYMKQEKNRILILFRK